MKKIICLVFVLSFSFPVFSDSSKKTSSLQSRAYKKQAIPKLQSCHQSTSKTEEDRSEIFSHLKRRYERGYGLQPHGEKIEQDDFGYTPNNKKTYRK
jgi:hypothetical protein